MVIQHRDGSLICETDSQQRDRQGTQDYYTSMPADILDQQDSLLDRIISFAFDTLGARRLEVRVRERE